MEDDIERTIAVADREFSFKLCVERNVELGPVVVDHWWMPVTPLYGQREQSALASNRLQILEAFHAALRSENRIVSRESIEKFLLASIVPIVRSDGSRRVLDDARRRQRRREDRDFDRLELNTRLRSDHINMLSEFEFEERSFNCLHSHDDYPLAVRDRYPQITDELLDGAFDVFREESHERAFRLVSDRWELLKQRYGRRSGQEVEKFVLDILSYEARAAFHQAYSAVWSKLVSQLAAEARSPETTERFLAFWHQDRVSEVAAAHGNHRSLFHGHVFALHPAFLLFIHTDVGAQQLGESLERPESSDRKRRLLRGMANACEFYAEMREEDREQRTTIRDSTNRDFTVGSAVADDDAADAQHLLEDVLEADRVCSHCGGRNVVPPVDSIECSDTGERAIVRLTCPSCERSTRVELEFDEVRRLLDVA